MEKEIKELQDKLDALKLKYELTKQPIKDGDVMENPSNKCIFKIVSVENNKCYGLDYEGNWLNEDKFIVFLEDNNSHLQLSTPEKWLEVCKNEAVKRGLVEGAKVNLSPVNPKFREKVKLMRNNYSLMQCGLSVDNLVIMQNGIWAEAIKPDVTLEILFEGWLNSESYVNHIKDNLKQFDKAINNLQNQK